MLTSLFLVSATGCGDDDAAAAAATGSGTDSATGGETEGDSDTDGPDLPPDGPCSSDADCQDSNACTQNFCGDAGTCEATAVVSNECRPQIDVEYPPRGATLQSDSPSVTVTGTVRSKAAPIASFTLNGEQVEVAQDGSFAHDIQASAGGNMLVFETADALEASRKRVQSFLWSNEYRKPTTPPEGILDEGLGIYIDQVALDDGANGVPIDDLASLMNLALSSFDLSQFFDADAPIASQAGYDIYLTDLTLGATSIRLQAIDGGVHIVASLVDIVGDLDFDCTTWSCELAGGDGTGGMSIDAITLRGNMNLSVNDEHRLDVTLSNVETTIDNLDLWSDNGWTNFLISIIEPFILGGIVSDLEDELTAQVQDQLGPALAEALSDLTLNTSLDLPNLADETQPITVDLVTDFAATDFHDGQSPPEPSPPQGGAIILRGGGYPAHVVTQHENLGVPLRNNCGASPMGLGLPRANPIEIGLSDDMLNQLLYAAWAGGLLEFPLDDVGGGDGGGGGFISDLNVVVSGMLAPTASDCGPTGEFLTTIGDIQIDASLTLVDQPIDFVAYSTIVMRLEVAANDGAIGLSLDGVEEVQTELSVEQDAAIDVEPTLVDVLEGQLVDGLLGELGGGALGNIELPEIDLSGQLGLDPGTAVLHIQINDVQRVEGSTVVMGQLGE